VASDVLWLQQAADLGDTEAVLVLAWRYVAGAGVPRNLTVARDLLAW
jgi:TPR repeat protein